MQCQLSRYQLSKRPPATGLAIDTTVKSSVPPWRAFAPTWEMVMAYKRHALSEKAYAEAYWEILRRVPEETWHALAKHRIVWLGCYCRDEWFCHTHLLIDWAVRRQPERFVDARAFAPSHPTPHIRHSHVTSPAQRSVRGFFGHTGFSPTSGRST